MLYFYFSLNMLSGTIPESMTNMNLLKDIYLFTNDLTGSIPAGIFNLTKLKYMYLDDNRFTGTIPDCIGNLKNTHQISLCENFLSGTIPSSLGNLKRIEYLFLFENQFTGTLPSSLGNMTRIEELSFSQNQLTGKIPSSLESLNKCEIFELDRNSLTGTIPSSFVYLERAQTISLDSNFLVGDGIQFITSQDLTIFYASNNFLTGTLSGLPPFLRLTAFDVSDNMYSGSLPNDLFANSSRLQIVNLNNNALSGSIPASLFHSKGLLSVVLAVNCFTGSIPSNICDSFNLIQLILDGLHAAPYCTTRAIPGWSRSGLISTNDVSGTIPRCLFQLLGLSVLHLGGNSFSGTIPDLPLPSKLNELVLASNELVGTIPSHIWYSNLTILDLSLNRLQGIIPLDMLPQAQLFPENASIQLNVNQIAGTIPSTLQSLASVNVLEGNMFSCNSGRSDIPPNDPHASTYQCGSDNTNISLIVMAIITTISFIALYCLLKYSSILLNIRIMLCTYNKFYAQSIIDQQFSDLKVFIYVMIGVCCVSAILNHIRIFMFGQSQRYTRLASRLRSQCWCGSILFY
jgi:Leucine-rich repeat (LRR) protein